jgi:hypothetical protein
VPHVIREQRIRQRLNWFRKAQELGSVTDACVFFGISRKTYYKWWRRYAASRWDRLSLADRSRRPHRHPRQVGTRLAWCLRRKGLHRSRPKHLQRYVLPRPGDCIQVDIKVRPVPGGGAAGLAVHRAR